MTPTPTQIVYTYIADNEPVTDKQICENTGLSSITILNTLRTLFADDAIWKEEKNDKIYYGIKSSYSLGPELTNLSDEEFYKKIDASEDAPGSIRYEMLRILHLYEREYNCKNIPYDEFMRLISLSQTEGYQKIIKDSLKNPDTEPRF